MKENISPVYRVIYSYWLNHWYQHVFYHAQSLLMGILVIKYIYFGLVIMQITAKRSSMETVQNGFVTAMPAIGVKIFD